MLSTFLLFRFVKCFGLVLSFSGDVIIDKINQVTTVVNKLNTIDNTYRNFAMEVIAGEENFITTTKEHGNTFQFDFSKVYWNPRLGKKLKKTDTLCTE